MDIKSLEALGISVESLEERIVDQAVEALLNATGYDPENDHEVRYESRFKREIEKRIQDAVDAKISALANEHLVPKVGEMIESLTFQKTNNYGEPKGEPLTFTEYIASRAEVYMSEKVDSQGRGKEECGSYDFRPNGPRLTVLMKLYIQEHLNACAKAAVTDINKVIAQNIQKAATDAIALASTNIVVSVKG